MNMTVGQAIALLQSHGHTFLAAEAVNNSLLNLTKQQQATEREANNDEATQSLDAWYSSQGYAFPPSAR